MAQTQFDRIVLMANDVDRLGGVGRFISTMADGFHARGYATELVGVSPPPEGHGQVVERSADITVRTLMPEPPPPDWTIRTYTLKVKTEPSRHSMVPTTCISPMHHIALWSFPTGRLGSQQFLIGGGSANSLLINLF